MLNPSFRALDYELADGEKNENGSYKYSIICRSFGLLGWNLLDQKAQTLSLAGAIHLKYTLFRLRHFKSLVGMWGILSNFFSFSQENS